MQSLQKNWTLVSSGVVVLTGLLLWKRAQNQHTEKEQIAIKNTIRELKHTTSIRNLFIVRDTAECEDLIRSMRTDEAPFVVGLDCEWRPNKSALMNNKVALIQICTSKTCLLIQISRMKPVPEQLKQLLNDRNVLKVGVGVVDDGSKLKNDYGISVQGCVDLVNVVKISEEKTNASGLRGLTKRVLGVEIQKGYHSPQCSDWDVDMLDQSQMLYAALDAYYSREIFYRLFLTKFTDSDWIQETVLSWCTECLDQKPKRVKRKKRPEKRRRRRRRVYKLPDPHEDSDSDDIMADSQDENPPSDKLHGEEKDSKQKYRCKHCDHENARREMFCQKCSKLIDKKGRLASEREDSEKKHSDDPLKRKPKDLYSTWKMLNSDGEFLARIRPEKFHWYLDRDLAVIVSESPPTIRLKFASKGPGHKGSKFYEYGVKNECVVCGVEGKKSHLFRHHVVPLLYRKQYPKSHKSHSSHDIVALCKPCKQKADRENESLKSNIAEETGFDLAHKSDRTSIDNLPDSSPLKAYQAALILSKYPRLPEQRVEFMHQILKAFFGVDDVTPAVIQTALELEIGDETKVPDHGEQVIKSLNSIDDIQKFTKRWRQHFLDSMEPKHLSPFWDVNHEDPNPKSDDETETGDVHYQ